VTTVITSLRQAISVINDLEEEREARETRLAVMESRIEALEAGKSYIDDRPPLTIPPFPVQIMAEIGIAPPWERKKKKKRTAA
jgi:hypothetical protein